MIKVPSMKTTPSHRRPSHSSSLRALSVCLLLAGPMTHAADTTTTAWSGTTSTTWATNTNWAGSLLPSATVSAKFDSTFANQPQLTSNVTTQGIWLATGVGQDVVIGKDGSARTINITGNATLNGQANAGILLDDSANHNLTLGDGSAGNYIIALTNSTGFYVNNSGTLTLQGLSNLNLGSNTLTLGGSNASGAISITKGITGNGAIVVNTAGVVTINNTGNNYAGGTTLTAGTLNINNAKALGLTAGTFAINGGTIDNTSGAAIASLSNNNAITIGGNFAFKGSNDLGLGAGAVNLGGATRTITTEAGRLTLGGAISNGGLTKAGAGTLALSAINSYSGTTTVSAGTLVLSGNGEINSSSSISVSAGATIENNNNASSVTPALALAEGAAVLTSAATSAFAPTSLTLSGNLSDGWSAISLTATLGSGLIKSGDLTLSLTGITAGTYNLTSGTGFSGSFTTANVNGSALTISGSDFSGDNIGGFDFDYTNSTNVLVVTAVPEPQTMVLLAVGLTAAMVLRRRRDF